MLYISGKPILGYLCFKYLNMTFSTNYALNIGFSKGLILKIYGFKDCGKMRTFLKFKLRVLY